MLVESGFTSLQGMLPVTEPRKLRGEKSSEYVSHRRGRIRLILATLLHKSLLQVFQPAVWKKIPIAVRMFNFWLGHANSTMQ